MGLFDKFPIGRTKEVKFPNRKSEKDFEKAFDTKSDVVDTHIQTGNDLKKLKEEYSKLKRDPFMQDIVKTKMDKLKGELKHSTKDIEDGLETYQDSISKTISDISKLQDEIDALSHPDSVLVGDDTPRIWKERERDGLIKELEKLVKAGRSEVNFDEEEYTKPHPDKPKHRIVRRKDFKPEG